MTDMPPSLLLAIIAVAASLYVWRKIQRSFVQLRADYRRMGRDFNRAAREAQNYRIASENASDGLVVQAMDGKIIWMNPAYCHMMGRPAHQMIGRHPFSFAIPQAERPNAKDEQAFRFDARTIETDSLALHRSKRGDRSLFWNQINVSHHIAPDGTKTIILVCRDVTEQIIKEKKLKDTHGHAAGDAVLKYVATQLQSVLRKSNLVARIGSDEFIVACPGLRNTGEMLTIGGALSEFVVPPLRWNDRIITCGISIGASLSSPQMTDADELLKQSDFALYDVKRKGRGKVIAYDDQLNLRHTRERGLASDLKQASLHNQLSVTFQPTMDAHTGALMGLETQAFWDHPDLGRLRHQDFANVAQQTGLSGDIGFQAMDAAIQLLHDLHRAGNATVTIGFNATPDCLAHPQFQQRLMAKTAKHNVAPTDLTICFSEASIHSENKRETSQNDTIVALNQLGFYSADTVWRRACWPWPARKTTHPRR
ncbi:MAG: diguanylate cyclase [Yoonia sp.]|nr:diguanylate cyclase [Yoonia sp.]